MGQKTKVVLGQLGSPKSPAVKDVRFFLKKFLGDPRVVDINPFLWKLILYIFVLPFRPKKSAEAYSRIWKNNSFPLITNTEKFANKVRQNLHKNIELDHCFLLSNPSITNVFDVWEKEPLETRADEVLIIPQFPQYSESTIASVFDFLGHDLAKRVNIPNFTFVTNYHRSKAFIDHSVKFIDEKLKNNPNFDLILSFHGIPLRRVLVKKDLYYQHCFETFLLITNRLKNIDSKRVHLSFQSRFGSEQWLGPATDELADNLVTSGNKKIAVYSPSFVVDCLETIDEIGTELKHQVEEKGGEFLFIECLNDDDEWSKDYAEFINVLVNGNLVEKNNLYYEIPHKEVMGKIPEQKMTSEPLNENSKSTLKIVFLTLFLDLIGFSIIFPMFPALAKHYLSVDPDNFFLKLIFGSIQTFTNMGDEAAKAFSPIVLFGGVLGALYSLLQFVAAPIWGSLSDKYGRRPILLISVFGLMVSYIIWFFSGSFTLIILARFIGGIMGGNISTATAVVADVTSEKNRSKGMAFIGIAFALGFIIGPAFGGLLSLINLTDYYPQLAAYGVNPFSMPALLAAVLSFINLIFIILKFQETLDKSKVNHEKKTSNIFEMFKPLPIKQVNQTNWSYFLFISAFAGMEFTLTFLAVERLSFSPLDNGKMFIFIGFIIALVQGGYVRRKAHLVGEKKMAERGLISIIPGLIIIALAESKFGLYSGLFFLAVGSAMSIPTLTSLVSLYSPSEIQGRSLGIFRSLGSLGRVIGPLIASVCYWKFGSSIPYFLGAAFMLLPILILKRIKD